MSEREKTWTELDQEAQADLVARGEWDPSQTYGETGDEEEDDANTR